MTKIPQMKPPAGRGVRRGWLITFTDLFALLLAFFVMLFSMSTVDPEPWKKMTNSLTIRLNPNYAWDGVAVLTDLDADSTDTDDATDLDYMRAVLADKIRNIPVLSQARLIRHPDRLIISLQADSLFAVGSAGLADDARAALNAMGSALRHINNRINVNGHTDPSPVKSVQYASNWELSLHRALAIADVLANAGYTREITAIGFAESRFDERDAALDRETRFRRARRFEVVIRDTQSMKGNGGV